MFTWNTKNGPNIHWFSSRNFNCNVVGKISWKYRTFSTWNSNGDIYTDCYVLPDTVDLNLYTSKHSDIVPEKATFYFDIESKFPRTKLSINSNYKRCIKLEKADCIVVNDEAKAIISKDIYCLFKYGSEILAITEVEFNSCFEGDLKTLQTSPMTGMDFTMELEPFYKGRLIYVKESGNVVSNYVFGVYTQPFILDKQLDEHLNKNLPDPDLQSLDMIWSMLNSTDRNTVRLGSVMAAGFNVNKWPLTFRVLLQSTTMWQQTYYGGNTVVVKQMLDSLKLSLGGQGLTAVSFLIQRLKEDYTKEDIALAQEFTRTHFDLEKFCAMNEPFYLDWLPFVPNEYKK